MLHVDILAGTWICILDGKKDWGVVDPASMPSSDWEEFTVYGERRSSKVMAFGYRKDCVTLSPGCKKG